jgi:hypothetical protein
MRDFPAGWGELLSKKSEDAPAMEISKSARTELTLAGGLATPVKPTFVAQR